MSDEPIHVESDGSGRWSAWHADRPEVHFEGDSREEAMLRLLQAHRRAMLKRFIQVGVCPDCNGSGRYVGLNTVDECSRCGGTGKAL